MINELRYFIFHTVYLRSFLVQAVLFILLCGGYSYCWYRFCLLPLDQVLKRYELSVKRMESQQNAHMRIEKKQLLVHSTRLHTEWSNLSHRYQLQDPDQRLAQLIALMERHHIILLQAQPESTELCGDYQLAMYKMRIACTYQSLMHFFDEMRKTELFVAFDDMKLSCVKSYITGEWHALFLVFHKA